jgi:hypothetical protein
MDPNNSKKFELHHFRSDESIPQFVDEQLKSIIFANNNDFLPYELHEENFDFRLGPKRSYEALQEAQPLVFENNPIVIQVKTEPRITKMREQIKSAMNVLNNKS